MRYRRSCVVRPGKVLAKRREDRLQCLLDCLLCVEADNGVGRVAVGCPPHHRIGILPGLAQKEPSFFDLKR